LFGQGARQMSQAMQRSLMISAMVFPFEG